MFTLDFAVKSDDMYIMIQIEEGSDRVRGTRAQRRASQTRRQLMHAAMEIFARKGMDATTIEDITEKADVGKGTFYRHFPNKDAVVAALTEEILNQLVQEMRTAKSQPRNLEEAFEQLLDAHAGFFADRAEEFFLLFQSRIMTRRHADLAAEQPFAKYMGELRGQIAPFTAVTAAKLQRLSFALAGFLSSYLSLAMIGVPRERLETSMSPVRQACLKGVLPFMEAESNAGPAGESRTDKTS